MENWTLTIIWIEILHLLRLYFRHYIRKEGTIVKSLRNGKQISYDSFTSGLGSYGPASFLFSGEGPHADLVSLYFFLCCFFSFCVRIKYYEERRKSRLDELEKVDWMN